MTNYDNEVNQLSLIIIIWYYITSMKLCNEVVSKLKVCYCSKFILTSAFICLQFSFLSQHGKNSYEDIYHSPPHVSVIAGNILITIIRFASYHLLLLASNSTFMTDSMYLGIIQICWNLNEHYYFLISTTSMIWQKDAKSSPFQLRNMLPFHIRLECLN